jgi:hypothetical protein
VFVCELVSLARNFGLFLGERYDFILNANQTPGDYWIKAKGYADCSVFKAFETAILRYDNVPELKQSLVDSVWYTYDNATRQGLVNNTTSFIVRTRLVELSSISIIFF